MNVGHNGDLPGDIYRFLGGAVIQDSRSDRPLYGIYSSVGIVIPSGALGNRISAPCAEPLLEMNGREHFLFFAIEAAQIREVGSSFALSGTVLPAVSADVTYTVFDPEGLSKPYHAKANAIGRCYVGRVECATPGVYRMKVNVDYQGKKGDVLGTGDGVYHNYVVDGDPEPLFTLQTQHGSAKIKADEDLLLRFEVDTAIDNPNVTYTVLMPGIVMSEGTIPVHDHLFQYVFSPREAAMQFSSYDVRDYFTGQKKLSDTVVFVFFLEGTVPGRGKVFDAQKLILRGDQLFH